jgi:uncharacterized phage protein (TIGR02218 family)
MSYNSREISIFQGQPFELYLFEAAEGTWGLTSGEKIRTRAAQDYTPVPIHRTSIGMGGEQNSGNVKVTIPRDHAIAQLFVGLMPAIPVTLTIYRGHEGETETIVQFVGEVKNASFAEDCELECAPEERLLTQQIPRFLVQAPCNKIIYSTACGADPEDFDTDATVTAVNGDIITAPEFDDGLPDGWFTNGYLKWGSFRRMIIRHVGDEVTLILPIPGLIALEVVTAFAGCARTYPVCMAKFSKGPNFVGFPWIPVRNPFKGIEY